jgi:hypothetical protein
MELETNNKYTLHQLNKFKKIFGPEKNTIVCFGDFEQKNICKLRNLLLVKVYEHYLEKQAIKPIW